MNFSTASSGSGVSLVGEVGKVVYTKGWARRVFVSPQRRWRGKKMLVADHLWESHDVVGVVG